MPEEILLSSHCGARVHRSGKVEVVVANSFELIEFLLEVLLEQEMSKSPKISSETPDATLVM
jgi:hypothetical protein